MAYIYTEHFKSVVRLEGNCLVSEHSLCHDSSMLQTQHENKQANLSYSYNCQKTLSLESALPSLSRLTLRFYPDTCVQAPTYAASARGVMGNRRTDLIKPKCPAESLSPSPAPVTPPNYVFCQEIGIQDSDPTKLDRATRLTRERPR